MLYHALEYLQAIEMIDAVSEYATPLQDRPVERETLYRLVYVPAEVTEHTLAPEIPRPLRDSEKPMLDRVLPLLESDGTYYAKNKWHGVRWVRKPQSIQKWLVEDHDLFAPVFIIKQAQELKRTQAA